mgnify:CR=1 FL=1
MCCFHLRIEHGKRVPPHRLRLERRVVGGAEQHLAAVGVDRVERRVRSTAPSVTLVPGSRKVRRCAAADIVGELCGISCAASPSTITRELVAGDARDAARTADEFLESFGGELQHFVAGGMPPDVVDHAEIRRGRASSDRSVGRRSMRARSHRRAPALRRSGVGTSVSVSRGRRLDRTPSSAAEPCARASPQGRRDHRQDREADGHHADPRCGKRGRAHRAPTVWSTST